MPDLEAARTYFLDALAAHQAADYARAESLLRKALEIVPDRVSVLGNLCSALIAQGRYGEASQYARRALELDPRAGDLHRLLAQSLDGEGRPEESLVHLTLGHVLEHGDADAHADHGIALLAVSRHAQALESVDRALALDGGSVHAWISRGLVLAALARREESVACLDRAIELDPRCAKALVNRAAVLLEMGKAAEALESADRALLVDAGDAQAWLNRGNALGKLGRDDEALECYDSMLAGTHSCVGAHPGHAGAWNNRGNTLLRLRRHAEALLAFDKALASDPGNMEAWSNRGIALSELGRHEEALDSHDRALALRPDAAGAWTNRGFTLSGMKRYAGALACYDRSLAIQPDLAEAWSNRGRMLGVMRRFDDALAAFDRALEIDPGLADAWLNRGNALYQVKRYGPAVDCYSRALALHPDIDHALGGWIHASLMLCQWSGLEDGFKRAEDAILRGRNVASPFQALAAPFSRETQRRCAELGVAKYFPPRAGAVDLPASTGRRLRIGYISADFRDHPVGYQLRGLLRWHDNASVELVGFSLRDPGPDAYRDVLRQGFARVHELGALPPQEAIDLMRRERLDVAVDLTGHTDGSRMELLAARIAPIQVNYLCPGTSGAPYFDYLVADTVTIPPGHQAGYTEHVVRLPGSFFVTDYRHVALAPHPSRAHEGLPVAGFVFACFCESYKITPRIWDVWMRVLRQVPQSVLWLGLRSNTAALENLRREAQIRGVAPDRLLVAKFAERREDHLSRLALADLCLDTPVYNGHTTTADALWAGVPVLTSPGDAFCGRVAASILNAIGLPELVARDLAAYEAIALRLAQAPGALAELRARLARNRLTQPLFDTERSVRHLEVAFRTMVERRRNGLPPESFAV